MSTFKSTKGISFLPLKPMLSQARPRFPEPTKTNTNLTSRGRLKVSSICVSSGTSIKVFFTSPRSAGRAGANYGLPTPPRSFRKARPKEGLLFLKYGVGGILRMLGAKTAYAELMQTNLSMYLSIYPSIFVCMQMYIHTYTYAYTYSVAVSTRSRCSWHPQENPGSHVSHGQKHLFPQKGPGEMSAYRVSFSSKASEPPMFLPNGP